MNYWDKIFEFNNDPNVNKLRNLYSIPSFFETLGLDRIEALHSNFIAWLLENKQLGLDDSENSLTRFLDVIVKNNNKQNVMHINEDLINSIASRSIIINDVNVDKEVAYKDKESNNRIDLIVTCDININNIEKELVLYIENKVYAPETFNKKANTFQTNDYYDLYFSEDAGQIQLFIFMSPYEDAKCDCDKFIRITYKDILLYVLEPIVKVTSINERDRMFIKEYIRTLGAQVLNNQDMGFIMAITNEEKNAFSEIYDKYNTLFWNALAEKISYQYKNSSPQTIKKWKDDLKRLGVDYPNKSNNLLVAFWNEHSSFIRNSIDICEVDTEKKETVLKMIAVVLKDRTQYKISYNGIQVNSNKSHLASELVKAYINLNNISNNPDDLDNLKQFFSNIREPFILVNKPDKEKLYDKIKIGNSSIWILNGVWGQGTKNFERLLEKAKKIEGVTID